MMRLIRNYNVTGETDIAKFDYADNTDIVSIEELRELLPRVKQLRNCELNVNTNNNGELILTVDGITYKTQSLS